MSKKKSEEKARRKILRKCNGCNEERDKRGHCWNCVPLSRDRLREELLCVLDRKQKKLFLSYEKVSRQFTGMIILD